MDKPWVVYLGPHEFLGRGWPPIGMFQEEGEAKRVAVAALRQYFLAANGPLRTVPPPLDRDHPVRKERGWYIVGKGILQERDITGRGWEFSHWVDSKGFGVTAAYAVPLCIASFWHGALPPDYEARVAPHPHKHPTEAP